MFIKRSLGGQRIREKVRAVRTCCELYPRNADATKRTWGPGTRGPADQAMDMGTERGPREPSGLRVPGQQSPTLPADQTPRVTHTCLEGPPLTWQQDLGRTGLCLLSQSFQGPQQKGGPHGTCLLTSSLMLPCPVQPALHRTSGSTAPRLGCGVSRMTLRELALFL